MGDDVPAILDDIAFIDEQITALLQRRAVLADHLAAIREAVGAPRYRSAEQLMVLNRYRDALGPAGVELARVLLHRELVGDGAWSAALFHPVLEPADRLL